MATQIPEIRKLNMPAIASMPDHDLLEAREYHIACLVKAYRAHDSDTTKAAVEWVVVLTSEMRLRGGIEPSAQKDQIVV